MVKSKSKFSNIIGHKTKNFINTTNFLNLNLRREPQNNYFAPGLRIT